MGRHGYLSNMLHPHATSTSILDLSVGGPKLTFVNPQTHIYTGARIMTVEEAHTPLSERRGRWDKETGRIMWDDETTAQSEVVGPAQPRRVRRTEPKPPPPPRPERNSRGFLPVDPLNDVRRPEILRLYREGYSIQAVAKRVHIAQKTVRAIVKDAGILRTHRDNAQRVLTEAQVLEIRASTETYKALRDRYKVAVGTIHEIRTGKTWRHLLPKESASD